MTKKDFSGTCVVCFFGLSDAQSKKTNYTRTYISLPKYYGASTTGDVWCFLKLEADKLTIDETKYFLSDLELLLGRLQFLVDDVQNASS